MSAWTGNRSASRGPKATRGARVSGRPLLGPGISVEGARKPGRNRRPSLPPGWAAIARKAKANREQVEKGTAAKAARSRMALSAKSAVKALGTFADGRPDQPNKKRVGDPGKRVGVTFVTFWAGMTLAAILSTSATLLALRTLGRKQARAAATSQVSEIHATSPMHDESADAQAAATSDESPAPAQAQADDPEDETAIAAEQDEAAHADDSPNGAVRERPPQPIAPSEGVSGQAAAAASRARAKMSELFRRLTGGGSGAASTVEETKSQEAKAETIPTEEAADRSVPYVEESRAGTATSRRPAREKRRRRSAQRRGMGAVASAQSSARDDVESAETSGEASSEERASDTGGSQRSMATSADSSAESSAEGGEWLDPFEIR